MAKKLSFADKAKRGQKKGPNFSMVKYVKSVLSEKTGRFRFKESMLKIPDGMNIDGYLKQQDEPEVELDLATEEEAVIVPEEEEAASETVEETTIEAAEETSKDDSEAETVEDRSESVDAESEPEVKETSSEDESE